ncbi:hypothetical protein SAMN04487969_13938 [Paenibacillus algorifonticola]|uniref:Uncharacterized protein n=1 Tax=Paenibacillus algorifonticola TaxID=684063 RepID=A0A1I2ITK5_9BACL|nr:hypothetical protein [Paenibacillus algorifonticola]SFF44096.1 hypothetical protein SAMN04487969_13938 [Paenibacillus algorifonticola]
MKRLMARWDYPAGGQAFFTWNIFCKEGGRHVIVHFGNLLQYIARNEGK